jgi:Asp/Glu/hydantoin racemase
VVLGGAGLAGLAARLQGDVDAPLVDSVHAGGRAIVAALGREPASHAAGAQAPTTGLSPALAGLLDRRS